MFARLARFVVRHPWWTIVVWVIAAGVIIGLSPKLETKSDQGDFLPSKYESVQAAALAKKTFPQQTDLTALIVVQRTDGGQITPVQVMVQSTDGRPLSKADLDAFGQRARSLPGIGGVQPAEMGKDPTVGRVDLVL